MFPKKNRADKKLIEYIFKNGNFINSHNISLKFVKSDNTVPRISFLSPKNTSKKAVFRNLLRRRGYGVLNKKLNLFPSNFAGVFVFGKKSIDCFGGKKNKNRNPIQNLENEIKKILNKIN